MGLLEPHPWLFPRGYCSISSQLDAPRKVRPAQLRTGRPRCHGPSAAGNSPPARQRSGCIPALSTADLLCFMKNEKNVLNEINSDEPKIS